MLYFILGLETILLFIFILVSFFEYKYIKKYLCTLKFEDLFSKLDDSVESVAEAKSFFGDDFFK